MMIPLVVPPSVFARAQRDPRFALACADDRIIENRPIPLDLGGAVIGMEMQAGGSIKIVP